MTTLIAVLALYLIGTYGAYRVGRITGVDAQDRKWIDKALSNGWAERKIECSYGEDDNDDGTYSLTFTRKEWIEYKDFSKDKDDSK